MWWTYHLGLVFSTDLTYLNIYIYNQYYRNILILINQDGYINAKLLGFPHYLTWPHALNVQTCPVAVSVSFAHTTGRMPAATNAGIKPSGNRVLQGVCCTVRLQQCPLAVTLWTRWILEPLCHSKLWGAQTDMQNHWIRCFSSSHFMGNPWRIVCVSVRSTGQHAWPMWGQNGLDRSVTKQNKSGAFRGFLDLHETRLAWTWDCPCDLSADLEIHLPHPCPNPTLAPCHVLNGACKAWGTSRN